MERQVLLREAVALFEKRAGAKIENGTNPSVTPILLTLDPMKVCARPLVWYVSVKVANIVLQMHLERRFGLRYGRLGDLE